ncbi:hypothetical protein [Nocardioides sp.]|uniref:hypothetical protein n=1 Tax=Nocardioides sp. TaxID=35761 RepID=UPI002C94A9AE|nr:hypothetical protein [Nocardioides sp.]HSX68137.1 hypothetical protein [Nocardioides sp.]
MSRNPDRSEQLPQSESPSSLEEETTQESPMASVLFHQPSDPSPWEGTTEEPDLSLPSSDLPDDSDRSDRDAATASEPPSTLKAKARALLPAARQAVRTAGTVAHTTLTQPETLERAEGLYLPDDEDVKAIATPLASIAARRVPDAATNPDVNDGVALVLGVVNYVVKQLAKRAQLVRSSVFVEQPAEDAA